MSPAIPWSIIGLTLAGVAIGRFPRLRMNRATIALTGATALVVLGALDLPRAYAALDLDTLVLLFAMMIVSVNLRLAGFFGLVAAWVVRRARTPRVLLAGIIAVAGVLAALFLNDTVVLMFTPLVLDIAERLRRDPIPYLVGLGAAANIGSVATIVGNPQNMLIGVASGIPFNRFTAALGPVAIVGLVLAWAVLVLVYRGELRGRFEAPLVLRARAHRPTLRKGLVAAAAMLAGFVAGVPVPLAALGGAALLLVTRRLKPERVFREIDWSLLVFFAGLFVVTGAIEATGLAERLFALARPLAAGGPAALTGVAAALSNIVSNVPAVMLFRPVIPGFADPGQAWLVLAMATTLAGNLTLLGSVANLIVAESARARGVRLSFGEYFRAGLPITLLTLGWGVLWLSFGVS